MHEKRERPSEHLPFREILGTVIIGEGTSDDKNAYYKRYYLEGSLVF
jgi:hypothetical protein